MEQEPFSLEAVIIAVTIIFLVLGAFIVMIMLVYRKRRNAHIIEKINLQSKFQQELLKTQIEVQEQTLNNISREIHDNISQVLSFVKLNLALTEGLPAIDQQQKITESRELIARAINDLRHLSKSLSFEHTVQMGLVKILEMEAERINNSGLINAVLTITGNSYSLGEQRELVLFRIFQETLNNTLKHANAKHLNISLQYSEQLFNLTLEDDGKGFLTESLINKGGSGLKNIENRATLIGAVATVNSAPGKGCYIKISLNPVEKQLYADGTHPDHFG